MANKKTAPKPTLTQLISEFEPEHLLLTSYTLDLITFERLLLQFIPNTQILIVVDRLGYQTAAMAGPAVRQAGTRYRVIQVDRPKFAFHPKIALMKKGSTYRLIVGSGNLTYSGICSNLEVCDWIDFDPIEDGPFCAEIASFLNALRQLLAGREGVDFINVFKGLELSGPTTDTSNNQNIHFFHSLNDSLFEQIESHLAEFRGSEVSVLSPFLDQGQFLKKLQTTVEPSKVSVIGPQASWDVGEEACKILAGIDGYYPVRCEDGRKLHAKGISFIKDGKELLVLGSANATRAAWMGSYLEGSGNAETILARTQAPAEDGFFQLLETKTMVFSPIKGMDSELIVESLLRVRGAEIFGNNAKVTMDPLPAGHEKFICEVEFWSLHRTVVPAEAENDGNLLVVKAVIPLPVLNQEWAGTLIRVKVQTASEEQYSDWAWLNNRELIDASAEDRPLRRAMGRALQGLANNADIYQLATFASTYMAQILQGVDIESSIETSNLKISEADNVSGDGVSPAEVSLSFHKFNQGSSSPTTSLQMIGKVLDHLMGEAGCISGVGKRPVALTDVDLDGDEDVLDFVEKEKQQDAEKFEFLCGIRQLAINALHDSLEMRNGSALQIKIVDIAIKFLYIAKSLGEIMGMRVMDASDSADVRDVLVASIGQANVEERLDNTIFCQTAIAWILWSIEEHKLQPTEQIKTVVSHCLEGLGTSDPLSDEFYKTFDHVHLFPTLVPYREKIQKILNVQTRNELAQSAIDLYILAAGEGYAVRKVKPTYEETQASRMRVGTGNLKSWLSVYDNIKLSKPRSVVCVDALSDNICTGCYSKLSPQKHTELLKNPQNPIQCHSCSRIIIGIVERSST